MPLSRKKSCLACQKAKSRCSRGNPCTRCVSRRLKCDYGQDCLIQPTCKTQPSNLQPVTQSSSKSPPAYTNVDDTSDVNVSRSSTEVFLGTGSTNANGNITTDSYEPIEGIPNALPDWEPFLQWPKTASLIAPDDSLDINKKPYNYNALLASHMSANPNSQLTYRVLIGQLLSYPRMMLTTRLPPFIYPECKHEDSTCNGERGHHCLPPALANCRTIVAMFETMTASNYDFIWRTIRSEAERLRSESKRWNSRQLLQAFQATLIYLLLAAKFFERNSSSTAIVLVQSCKTLGERLHRLHDCGDTFSHIPASSRQDWTFKESIRRTICVLYGMELLLDVFSDHRDRCPGYLHVPLPCSRELWDPVSDVEWTRRYQQSTSGHAKHTHEPLRVWNIQTSLAHTRSSSDSNEVSYNADMEAVADWCEGVDELGTLIWMAVLLEAR